MLTLLKVSQPTRMANGMWCDIFYTAVELKLPWHWAQLARWTETHWLQLLFHWHMLITHSLFYIPSLTHRWIENGCFRGLFAKLSPWMYLPSFICPSLPSLSSPEMGSCSWFRGAVSSLPGHSGAVWLVDLILVWCLNVWWVPQP